VNVPGSPASTPERPDARFGVRALLAAVALTLVAVPLGLLLFLVKDGWSPLLSVDEGARDELNSVARGSGGFVDAMEALSTVGSTRVYLVLFAAVVVWLLTQRRPRLAAFVAVTTLGSWGLNNLVKLAVDRARPVLPDPVAGAPGLSFPSGHAQAAMVGYAVLALVFLPLLHGVWRTLAIVLALVMVAAIGFSRVALGVHFVSDVLAGYVLGAAWTMAMVAAFSAWKRERGNGETTPSRGLEPQLGSPP